MPNNAEGPAAWVASAMLPWFENPHRDVSQLARWLSGNDLPPVGQAEEPYVWLLRTLPRGSERPKFESALAASAAELLRRCSDLRDRSDGPRLLYNLLSLSAGLRGRDCLPRPLLQLLQQDALRGLKYDANLLNSVLLSALIYNQSDDTLQPIWDSMVLGEPHPILGGNPADGFQGLAYMPPSSEERGSPAVQAIGFGLTHLLSFIDSRPNRVFLLRSFIDQLRSRYPGHHWEIELIHFSDRYGWPRWTDVALPSLAIQRGRGQYIVWFHVKELMAAQFVVETVNSWAEGRVCEVTIPPAHVPIYETIARTAEKYRRRTYFGGERAERGIVSAVCEDLSFFFLQQDRPAAAAAVARVGSKNSEVVYATA